MVGEVLEIGGGSGAMAAGVATSYPEIRLTVTDVDDTMLGSARVGLAGFPNVTVTQADVTQLPFEHGRFDTVTSYLMLHHVVDWTDALAEISRVLKPGGTFIGYDLTDTRVARAIHRADGSPHRIIAPDELAGGLAAVGFIDIAVHTSWAGHLMRFRTHRPAGG